MLRRTSVCVMLLALAFVSRAAEAQRGRNSPAMSPDGPVFNPTLTPEWKMAGGNPYVYEQIMEQKMQMLQMQQMMKEEKQFQDYLKKHPEVKQKLEQERLRQLQAMKPRARTTKKRGTTSAAAKSASKDATKAAAKTETTDTPADPDAPADKAAAPAKKSLANTRGN